MDPNNNIQKKILEETEKWADYDKRNEAFGLKQLARFQPMLKLLNELCESIESEYIKIIHSGSSATIDMGLNQNCESKIKWSIEPDFKIQKHSEEYWFKNLWQKKELKEEMPGFLVIEWRGDDAEKIFKFESEMDVIEHLASAISKRVVFYRRNK